MLRCLIVDDSASFLDAATTLLERQGLAVAGVASTTDEALRRVGELHPDIVLVDITLGAESGFDLARRLAKTDGDMTVIFISTHAEADFADLIAEAPGRASCRSPSFRRIRSGSWSPRLEEREHSEDATMR